MIINLLSFLPCLTFTAAAGLVNYKRAVRNVDQLQNCNEICPANYMPVCGSDGKTYSNSCTLAAASCKEPSKNLVISYEGQCNAQSRRCIIRCTKDYKPVCGSDGKTYSNLCNLEISSCENPLMNITQAYAGECVQNCPSYCIEIYNPVCGSDGKTYDNPCYLQLSSCQNPLLNITKLYDGQCGSGCIKICTFDYKPVCGSDGKTYPNLCSLENSRCQNPQTDLTQVHDGECGSICQDSCTFEYKPVCGSDGVTYPNLCSLQVSSCQNPELQITKVQDGECAKPSCPSICTFDYSPVCGSDGMTYTNQCSLEISSCENPSKNITRAYYGRCVNQMQCNNFCSNEYMPVCGSDRRTYPNLCALQVVSCMSPSLNLVVAYQGECHWFWDLIFQYSRRQN